MWCITRHFLADPTKMLPVPSSTSQVHSLKKVCWACDEHMKGRWFRFGQHLLAEDLTSGQPSEDYSLPTILDQIFCSQVLSTHNSLGCTQIWICWYRIWTDFSLSCDSTFWQVSGEGSAKRLNALTCCGHSFLSASTWDLEVGTMVEASESFKNLEQPLYKYIFLEDVLIGVSSNFKNFLEKAHSPWLDLPTDWTHLPEGSILADIINIIISPPWRMC